MTKIIAFLAVAVVSLALSLPSGAACLYWIPPHYQGPTWVPGFCAAWPYAFPWRPGWVYDGGRWFQHPGWNTWDRAWRGHGWEFDGRPDGRGDFDRHRGHGEHR